MSTQRRRRRNQPSRRGDSAKKGKDMVESDEDSEDDRKMPAAESRPEQHDSGVSEEQGSSLGEAGSDMIMDYDITDALDQEGGQQQQSLHYQDFAVRWAHQQFREQLQLMYPQPYPPVLLQRLVPVDGASLTLQTQALHQPTTQTQQSPSALASFSIPQMPVALPVAPFDIHHTVPYVGLTAQEPPLVVAIPSLPPLPASGSQVSTLIGAQISTLPVASAAAFDSAGYQIGAQTSSSSTQRGALVFQEPTVPPLLLTTPNLPLDQTFALQASQGTALFLPASVQGQGSALDEPSGLLSPNQPPSRHPNTSPQHGSSVAPKQLAEARARDQPQPEQRGAAPSPSGLANASAGTARPSRIKRPRTAYNLFYCEEKNRLPKMPLKNLTPKIAEHWNALDDRRRSRYYDLAAQDMERYRLQVQKLNEKRVQEIERMRKEGR